MWMKTHSGRRSSDAGTDWLTDWLPFCLSVCLPACLSVCLSAWLTSQSGSDGAVGGGDDVTGHVRANGALYLRITACSKDSANFKSIFKIILSNSELCCTFRRFAVFLFFPNLALYKYRTLRQILHCYLLLNSSKTYLDTSSHVS